MVKKGSQTRNNEEIRELVRNSKEIAPGQYLVTDRLNNMLVVDVEEGIIYNFDGDELEEANTADQSKKANGYLYVQIVIFDENNVPVTINYAQHSLIAMLAHTDDYDSLLVEDGKTPIVNHKNNCPWDNYSKNLEWTTQKWNGLHGKVIHGIYRSNYSDTYTEIRHNKSKVDFICLKVRLSVKLIERYENYIKAQGCFKSLKEFWGLKEKTDVISNADIIDLIDWLDKQV